MALFKNNNGKLQRIKEEGFNLEKEMQSLCEENMNQLFNLKFIASEFSVDNFRIDTLAYDEETKSFVIIEYKNTKSYSVIDQGYSYLSNMLNNKAEYILQYITNTGKTILKSNIDWSQSRIFFVSPKYTKYQLESINFKDLPIYLYHIKKYKGNLIDLELITANDTSASINTVSSNEIKNQVNKEVKVYTEDEHLRKTNDKMLEIYHEIKDEILDFGDNTEIKVNKDYLAFTVNNQNFCDIILQKTQLKLFINLKKGELNDPKELMRDVSTIGHWGNGDYEIKINSKENIYDILSLIKQSYDIKVQ